MTIPTPGIENEEAWSGVQILGKGRHHVRLAHVEEGQSGGGHPALKIQFEAVDGSGEIRDTLAVIQSTYGKVLQLYQAVGAGTPSGGVSAADVQGKTCDIRVDEVPRRDDPSRLGSTVVAYLPHTSTDGTPTTAQNGGGQAQYDDIPF